MPSFSLRKAAANRTSSSLKPKLQKACLTSDPNAAAAAVIETTSHVEPSSSNTNVDQAKPYMSSDAVSVAENIEGNLVSLTQKHIALLDDEEKRILASLLVSEANSNGQAPYVGSEGPSSPLETTTPNKSPVLATTQGLSKLGHDLKSELHNYLATLSPSALDSFVANLNSSTTVPGNNSPVLAGPSSGKPKRPTPADMAASMISSSVTKDFLNSDKKSAILSQRRAKISKTTGVMMGMNAAAWAGASAALSSSLGAKADGPAGLKTVLAGLPNVPRDFSIASSHQPVSAGPRDNELEDLYATAHVSSGNAEKELELITARLNELETSAQLEEQDELMVERAFKKSLKDFNGLYNASDISVEDKLNGIRDKYLATLGEVKASHWDLLKYQRTQDLLLKEKALLRLELAKSSTLRSKLEGLCRELSKENKKIKEETSKLAAMEQKKRDDLSLKFELAIQEITYKLQDSTEETMRRVSDTETLKEKFYGFLEQYELREKHFNSVIKSKDLELKLAAAKLGQQLALNESASIELDQLKKQLSVSNSSEESLKDQLAHYVDKFRQVEETLAKSNELFSLFRKEMESMTVRLSKLEREKSQLTTHCETFQKNCLDLFQEKNQLAEALEEALAKKDKLEVLCRALQNERKKGLAVSANAADTSPIVEIQSSSVIPDSPTSNLDCHDSFPSIPADELQPSSHLK